MGQAAQVGPYTAQGGMIREKPFDCDCGGSGGGGTPAAPSLANVVANQKRGGGGVGAGNNSGPIEGAPGAGANAPPPPELVAAAQAGDPQAQSDLQNWLGGAALVGGAGGAAYLASKLMKSRGGATPGSTGVSGAPPMQEMQALPAPIDAEYRVVDEGSKSLANSVADRQRLTHDTHGPISRRNPTVRTPPNEGVQHPTIAGQEPPQDIKARQVEGAYQQRGAQNEANMEAERLAAVLAQRYKVQRAGKALSRVVR